VNFRSRSVAPAGATAGGSVPVDPSAVVSGHRSSAWSELLVKQALRALAFAPLVALSLIVLVLVLKAMPAIRYNGIGFFGRDTWKVGSLYANPVTTGGVDHPVGASYGALPLIVGTLESSAIALVLAIPIGVGTAMIVVQKLPAALSSAVGFFLEVLAGVPSVVYGLWGYLTLGPFLAKHLSGVANDIPNVPVLRFFKGPTQLEGLLPTGIVLAIMVLPIIAATTRDLIRQVPRATLEGAQALGMTDAETTRTVTFPWIRSGVIGASMLGLGRALGETIAVAMISGVVLGTVPHTIFSTFSTIAAVIVSQLDGALTDGTGLAVATLAEIALVLMVITLITNIGARLLVNRAAHGAALPVGRGI
jgi:phosphate transport system permease protein